MRFIKNSGMILATWSTILGCGPTEPNSRATVTHPDSAGVIIKEYTPPTDWTAPVTLREVTRIGTLDGPPPTLFSSIPGGRILDDGTLVLVDRDSREVRIFTVAGQFVRSHGRQGEGPGEYEFIIGVGRCAGTGFTVFDIGWAMSHYDEAGEFIREEATRLEDGSMPYNLACDRRGRLAVVNWDLDLLSGGPTLGFHTASARLRIIQPDRGASLDLGERIGSERFGRPSGSGPHPAGRSTKFGFAGSELIVSDGSFFGFERWDTAGRLSEIVRISDVPPPDADSLMAEYLEWSLARTSDEDGRRSWRQEVSEMVGPEQAAYFSDLFVSDGHVLLRGLNVGGEGRWFMFELDGTPAGYLPLSPGAQLLDFRDGFLLASVKDEMGVQSAVLYEVGTDH